MITCGVCPGGKEALDVGEAIATSGTEDGELETRVGQDLAERCIAANEQLATG